MRGGLLIAHPDVGVETSVAQECPGPCPQPRLAPASSGICAGPCSPTLGTFEPTPYLMVRGNGTTGGGYSPLDVYGDQSMTLYGPLSALRATSAPVTTYSRGYDGRIYAGPGTSFSTPNLPGLSPVIYPTHRGATTTPHESIAHPRGGRVGPTGSTSNDPRSRAADSIRRILAGSTGRVERTGLAGVRADEEGRSPSPWPKRWRGRRAADCLGFRDGTTVTVRPTPPVRGREASPRPSVLDEASSLN